MSRFFFTQPPIFNTAQLYLTCTDRMTHLCRAPSEKHHPHAPSTTKPPIQPLSLHLWCWRLWKGMYDTRWAETAYTTHPPAFMPHTPAFQSCWTRRPCTIQLWWFWQHNASCWGHPESRGGATAWCTNSEAPPYTWWLGYFKFPDCMY